MFGRSTENDHVVQGLPARLQRIRTFGKLELTDFQDLITEEDMEICRTHKSRHTTWYSLTMDVFVKFLFQV